MTPVTISGPGVSVEVSSATAFSKDNKWCLLIHPSGFFGLYTGAGVFVRLLPSRISARTSPRWDRRDPDLLTYIYGNALETFDPNQTVDGDELIDTLRVFSEYVKIDDFGEADLSHDGDHRVFAGTRADGGIEIFTYDLHQDRKEIAFPQSVPFDGLKIGPSNQMILSRSSGILNLLIGKQLTSANGHAAVAVYGGRDYLLWFNSNEFPITLPQFKNGVVMVDMETGSQRGLISFPQKDALGIGWAYSCHISACDRDFCLVSIYAPDNSLPMQLWKVPLDGSPPSLLCETGGVYRDYDSQPKASASRDGTRCVFCFDDGQNTYVKMLHLAEEEPDFDKNPDEPLRPFGPGSLTPVQLVDGMKWHLTMDFEAKGGELIATNVKMYDRKV